MPCKTSRKMSVRTRCTWTQESLRNAIEEMKKNRLGINAISRRFGIPSRTLRRRFANKNIEKVALGNCWNLQILCIKWYWFLGRHPFLDIENEKRLVLHIQKLENEGFPATRDLIRRLAFEFAEKLGIQTTFNKNTRKAGHHWLRSFLERHPELCVDKLRDSL